MRRQEFIALYCGAAAAALVALTSAGVTRAQTPLTIERIEVVRPGTYDITAHGTKLDEAISTGSRIEVRGYKILQPGTQIAARAGTIIGAEVTIVGTPRHAKAPLKVMWRYPEPGLVNPSTKVARTVDEYSDTQLVGEKFPIFWGLTQVWHLVPGIWTVEIWHDDRKLATQQFQLMKP